MRNSSEDKTLHITDHTSDILKKEREPMEEILEGGNVNSVVRVEDTVRRDMCDSSPNIHYLLKFLEEHNYDYAPQFIGIDENKRETLSFIEGVAGNDYDLPYIWSDENLITVASKLKEFHDITSQFISLNDVWALSCPDDHEVICHNDFAPYNTIYRDEKAVGIIDFDACSAGSRRWDIAYSLFCFAPLTSDEYDSKRDRDKIKRRVKLFCESYGYEDIPDILETVVKRVEYMISFIDEQASLGAEAFVKIKAEGHGEYYMRQLDFIKSEKRYWH